MTLDELNHAVHRLHTARLLQHRYLLDVLNQEKHLKEVLDIGEHDLEDYMVRFGGTYIVITSKEQA